MKKFFYHLCNRHVNCKPTCKITRWDVPKLLTMDSNYCSYAVIVLNRPISCPKEYFINFWNNARFRITVDGGTEQWDNFINQMHSKDSETMKLPDLVTGDFDSLPKHLYKKFQAKGCKMIHTPDQNYTDFTKSLMELSKYCEQTNIKIDHIIALGQCSGRLDHTLGNIHTLYLTKRISGLSSRLYLMSDDSLSWLLESGEHLIKVPMTTKSFKGSWCSLIPLGETCDSVTTSGLRWNLDKEPLEFGSRISSSNSFGDEENVRIKCSHTLLWSMYTQLMPESRI